MFGIIFLGSALAACSSPSVITAPPPTSTSTPNANRAPALSLAELRAQFLADETTASNLSTQAGTAIDRLPSDASASALAAAAAPIVSGGQAYLTQLQHLPWPTNMTSDAKAIEEELSRYIELVQSARIATVSSDATWSHAESVLATLGQATNKLRHDLGLPPITSP